MSFLFRLCLGFLLLTPVATRASVLEIPGTGSNLPCPHRRAPIRSSGRWSFRRCRSR